MGRKKDIVTKCYPTYFYVIRWLYSPPGSSWQCQNKFKTASPRQPLLYLISIDWLAIIHHLIDIWFVIFICCFGFHWDSLCRIEWSQGPNSSTERRYVDGIRLIIRTSAYLTSLLYSQTLGAWMLMQSTHFLLCIHTHTALLYIAIYARRRRKHSSFVCVCCVCIYL